jgi:hypothetical protein
MYIVESAGHAKVRALVNVVCSTTAFPLASEQRNTTRPLVPGVTITEDANGTLTVADVLRVTVAIQKPRSI